MAPTAVSSADQALLELVSGSMPTTIADVMERMQSIDGLLPASDGLKWFNRLYLMVTQQVDRVPPADGWRNSEWLLRLDVEFAALYFTALRNHLAGHGIPSAWKALLESRFCSGVDRIQFAVAGMNAHINRDLAVALLNTSAALNVLPAFDSPEHSDYEAVNILLDDLMPSALTMLAADLLGVLAEDTGKVGRLLAFWNICRARDLAWDFSKHLRDLPGIAREAALSAQDTLTGALGRAILFGL